MRLQGQIRADQEQVAAALERNKTAIKLLFAYTNCDVTGYVTCHLTQIHSKFYVNMKLTISVW